MIQDRQFIIVGQGIAGTCMAHELIKRGATVNIFDSEKRQKATLKAAGVINPITGRRFVKTWLADQLIRDARSFYSSLEAVLKTELVRPRTILHALDSPFMEENWAIRQGDPHYADYLGGVVNDPLPKVLKSRSFAVVNGGLQVDVGALIAKSAGYFEDLGVIIHGEFEYEGQSGNRTIIYCDGSHNAQNQMFSPLRNMFAKGEALVCNIPELRTNEIIKNGIVIAPYRDGLRWIGSTYDREDAEPTPTARGKEKLCDGLNDTLLCNWEIHEHFAGIRPTTVDRRPYIGKHPEHDNIYLLNGLGAKGASLAPFGARIIADHLESNVPIPSEVDILRYWR